MKTAYILKSTFLICLSLFFSIFSYLYVSDNNKQKNNIDESGVLFRKHVKDGGVVFDKLAACQNAGYILASSAYGNFVEVISLDDGVEKSIIGSVNEKGRDRLHLFSPTGVACNEKKNHVVIADSGNKRIATYDMKHFNLMSEIKYEEYISDISVDAANNRLLIMSGRSYGIGGCCNIFAMNNYSEGNSDVKLVIPLRKNDEPMSNYNLYNPSAMFLDENSRLLYIADSGHSRIQIFDSSTFKYIATIGVSGISGSDNMHLKEPMGVAVDNKNNSIYVADMGNRRIQVFSAENRKYKNTISGDNVFLPDSIVVIGGKLFVIDRNKGYVAGRGHNYINEFRLLQ